jgi:putative aldouronate transport system permease protein
LIKFKKQSISDKVFDILIYFIAAAALIIVIYPLIFVLSSSFSSPEAVISGKVWLLPVDFSLEGYKAVFENNQIWTGYKNSIFYVMTGTTVKLVMTILAAYPLSRKDFKPRNKIMALFVFTMFFNGGLIPTYLLIKELGMINKISVMIIPEAVVVYYIILARTYFASNIPDSLMEASQLDGCSDVRFLLSVVLPLSKPIIAVLVLFSAVTIWNSYFTALIYLSDEKKLPIQIILRNILILNQLDINTSMKMGISEKKMFQMMNLQQLMKYSLIIVATVPVLILYPFVQKYFIKGVMIGAIKG